MIRLSPNAVRELGAPEGDVAVVLVTITHESLPAPIRISSDPTERLSTEPLRYGTRSRGEEYEYVLMTPLVPDDSEGAATATSLEIDRVDGRIDDLVRSFTTPAQTRFELVFASSPDFVEQAWDGLETVAGSGTEDTVTIDVSREDQSNERWPYLRMTKDRFPGLQS